MGTVLRFPGHPARASAGSGCASERACMEASAPKVTSANPRASAAATMAVHHSAGSRSRKYHLRTAKIEAPVSPASVSSDGLGQSEQTARGVRSVMVGLLGPDVLNVKANVSYDESGSIRHVPGMDRMSETEEKLAFIGRVRAARKARFDTQGPMCTILGIEQGTYKQYEKRTPLPHRYIPKFCAATGVTMEWLLTGEGRGPAVQPFPSPRERKTKVAKRRAA